MGGFSLNSWEAVSTVVTAIGVLTALALGLWANWLQYKQAKKHDTQNELLVRAWSIGLATDLANTMARAKKLQLQMDSRNDSESYRSLLAFCEKAYFIESSYIDPFLSRVDIFPLSVSQSLVSISVETRRLQFIVERIKSGGKVALPDGSNGYFVIKKSLEAIIGWGKLALPHLYAISRNEDPPDIEKIARDSIRRDAEDGDFLEK